MFDSSKDTIYQVKTQLLVDMKFLMLKDLGDNIPKLPRLPFLPIIDELNKLPKEVLIKILIANITNKIQCHIPRRRMFPIGQRKINPNAAIIEVFLEQLIIVVGQK